MIRAGRCTRPGCGHGRTAHLRSFPEPCWAPGCRCPEFAGKEGPRPVPAVTTKTTVKTETSYAYTDEELAACLGYTPGEDIELTVRREDGQVVLTITETEGPA